MGRLVREQGLTPDVIISSGRGSRMFDGRGRRRGITICGRNPTGGTLLYAASRGRHSSLCCVPVTETTSKTVMIVGHNPGLEELVAQLTGEQQELPTAALAQIVLPIARWRDLKKSTRGRLVDLWRPKD